MLISNIHDMLESIRLQGIKDIHSATAPQHPGMIGDMYEGLTKELMDKAVFRGLDLHIGAGKIKNMSNGKMSRQIDCMIYQGESETLPFTSHKIVDIRKVIAVIEVKKNLYLAELNSAYQNLLSVTEIFDPDDLEIETLRISFESVTGLAFPRDKYELSKLPYEQQMIYHLLVVELCLPIRVIWGYEGFKSEESLRDAFDKMLRANQGEKGYGITSFPSLIISEKNSIIKMQGMPYAMHAENASDWIFYASYDSKPIWLFLEMLWSRLTFQFHVPGIGMFDELHNENLRPFLAGRALANGMEYTLISLEKLKVRAPYNLWQPVFISNHEFVIFNELCSEGFVKIDESLAEYLSKNDDTIDNFIAKFVNERIIVVHNGSIELSTSNLICVILPDGRFAVGENVNNRFVDWIWQTYPHR